MTEFKNGKCFACKHEFDLCWSDTNSKESTILIRLCPSASVVEVTLHCPRCGNYEQLKEV